MRILITAICLLIAAYASASEQELPLKSDANGQPHFGMQYAYDTDAVWAFTYSSAISDSALTNLPAFLFWAVAESNTNQVLTSWNKIAKGQLRSGSLRVSERSVVAVLLPNLKSSKIVFATKSSPEAADILLSIPVGPLCQNYPNQIVDLTNTSKPACSVTAQDIPQEENACERTKAQLLGYVKKNLLTCAIAKQQFAKRACGVLDCQ